MSMEGGTATSSAPPKKEPPGEDEARQKLWSITTEYENLLQVQNQHFESVLATKDKVIDQLKAGKPPYDFSDPGVVSVAVEERDREIRLYKCLLEIRDKQLMELQHVIDYGAGTATPGDMSDLASEKNAQIQTLMDELQVLREEVLQMKSSSSARGPVAGVTTSTSDELQQLRKEKEDLEKIVLQKEKQIQAISTIDTTNNDISALQLGARAISMYTEAMQMRQEIKDRDGTIASQGQEIADLELRDQQRQTELEQKRGEIGDMTKVIAEKTRRVLELENALQAARQDVADKTREIEGLCDAVEQARKNTLAEQGAKNRIIEELREELSIRDRTILEERAERVRMETLNEELQGKSGETLQQLKEAQSTMDQMMAHTQYQGQLVRDMTSQVQESEAKLHTLQVQEMYEKRRRVLEEKIREQETAEVLQSKDILLNQVSLELNETRERLGNIRRDLEPANAALNRSLLGGTTKVNLHMSTRSQAASEFSPAAGNRTGPSNSPQAQLLPQPAQVLGPGDETQRQLVAALQPNPATLPSAISLLGTTQEQPNLSTLSMEEEQVQYQPYPDDLLDAQLANYLLENPKHVPLFCRLSHGQYLYGTHRVSMRLQERADNQRVIEALGSGGNWVLLEELLRDKLGQAQMLYNSQQA
ncbi:unnamed protein product [Amoebophrya sp. A120]|nr:unnamed protein product [Amoebophrya sp. A120]|eukprot:GSA120T00002593001.1